MTRTLAAVSLALALWAPVAHAMQPPPEIEPVAATEVPPRLTSLEVTSADAEFAGRHAVGQSASRTVTFRNRLPVPIELSLTGKTCGCLEAVFEPAAVPPGGTTKLTLRAVVGPTLGEQNQSAGFEASWMHEGRPRTERGRVVIRYMADIEFSAFPKTIVLSGVKGREAVAYVVLRALAGADRPPDIAAAVCSHPGWVVEAVKDKRVGELATLYRVRGPVGSLGFKDGDVTWTTRNPAQPTITVPLRVEGLTPYRAFPGGAWFAGPAPLQAGERVVTLTARTLIAAKPARIRLSQQTPAVHAELTDDKSVRITFSPRPDTPPVGSVRALVEAEDGTLLIDIPVVWYTRDAVRQPGR